VARRSRLFKFLTLMAVVVVLAAGITAVLLRSAEKDHPSEWDPRVLDLVNFVQRERGALFDHPVAVDFLTPEEYSEGIRTDEEGLSEEEKAETEQFEGVMRALGLLSGDADLLEASNDLSDAGTLAYYDSFDERVVVRGTEMTPGLAVTLVHELTHALQDQVFDLDRYQEGDEEASSGESFAFRALIEGDAHRIEEIYLGTLDPEVRDAIEEEEGAGLEQFEEADIPDALTALFGSMYGLGEAFVTLVDVTDGQSVDAAFADQPTTEEQVFDPFEYLDRGGPVPVDMPESDGEDPFDGGDFGAVSLMVVLAERIDPRQALVAATGWGGDAYTVFPRDGRTCIRLDVTGDTPDDTTELADALAAWVDAAPAGVATTSREGDLVHLESCDPGADVGEGSGGSIAAVQLAVSRVYVAVGFLQAGGGEEQARCMSRAVVDAFSEEELTAEELTPAMERRLAGLVRSCE
jgi:hypothetical protein